MNKIIKALTGEVYALLVDLFYFLAIPGTVYPLTENRHTNHLRYMEISNGQDGSGSNSQLSALCNPTRKPAVENFFCENDYRYNTKLIKQHTRTGRPLGSTEFIGKLEVFTGEELAPKRPGRKPIDGK